MSLNENQIELFARHLVLPEVGITGQEALLRASVLVVGAGGLGAAMLPYLAAAGIGRIGLVDDDTVSASNLQRQVIYKRGDVGQSKAEQAKAHLLALNPDITVDLHSVRLDRSNAPDLIENYDLVADGSDNMPTRLALHDACFRAGKALVSGAAQGMDGQLTTYLPHKGDPHPCMRCMSGGIDPSDADLPSCAQAGVLGPVVAVIGSLQAAEIIRVLASIGDCASGRMLIFDATTLTFDDVKFKRLNVCKAKCRYLPDI